MNEEPSQDPLLFEKEKIFQLALDTSVSKRGTTLGSCIANACYLMNSC